MLLQAALFFGLLATGTTLGALAPRAIRARMWAALPLGLALIALTVMLVSLPTGNPMLDTGLALIALAATAGTRLWQPKWSWLGAQLFATAVLAAATYLLFAGQLTYENVRGPLYLIGSTALLLLELAALALSASYLFEIIDVLAPARIGARGHH